MQCASFPYQTVGIVGLGLTGQSALRFLSRLGVTCYLCDQTPKAFDSCKGLLQSATTKLIPVLGDIPETVQQKVELWLISPGVNLASDYATPLRESRAPIWTDIDLFMAFCDKPVIGITGSNGKSSVTSYIGQILNAAGKKAAIGGNIGIPALDLFDERSVDIYVLELSSFQLEKSKPLALSVAVFLNLSPDHLDAHGSLAAYHAAKQRIYQNAQYAVYNADDAATYPPEQLPARSFGASESSDLRFVFAPENPQCIDSDGVQLSFKKASVVGRHQYMNLCATYAAVHYFGISPEAFVAHLPLLQGLPYRCERIAQNHGVSWYNDSKATNTASTFAAVQSISEMHARLILILGGRMKGEDYQLLQNLPAQVHHILLIGEATDTFFDILAAHKPCQKMISLEEAVNTAEAITAHGDAVLFSPACASFDMFDNFMHRGQIFNTLVWQRTMQHHASTCSS